VRGEARLTFYEKGMSRTRDRIGVLVYVSLLERMADVVPDSGLYDALPKAFWEEAAATIGDAIGGRLSGPDVVRAMLTLKSPLATAVPRQEDDENELPDEVCAT